MLRSAVVFLLTACLCLPTPIASESRGAPTCVTGAAPGQPHTDERYLQLLIDEFSFIEILVDSPRFGVRPVKLGRTVYVPVNQTITVTVTKADRPYRGIMTRIGGGSADVDTATAFILNDDEVELKYNQYCDLDVSSFHILLCDGYDGPCPSHDFCLLHGLFRFVLITTGGRHYAHESRAQNDTVLDHVL